MTTTTIGPSANDANTVPDMAALAMMDGLILDCDGVLTTGELFYDENGRRMLSFHARDGMGLALLTRAGIRVAVLSGRPADIAEKRYKELGIEQFVGRCRDKARGLLELCQKMGLEPKRCAFVGDDLADLPAFRCCGYPIAVADAVPEVLATARWVTRVPGGHGAVREVCEAFLKAHGQWETIVAALRGE